MKGYNYILLFSLFTASIFLISISLNFDANTGSEKFDEQLNDINKEALADISAFKNTIVREYNVDDSEVTGLISTMEPAEILLSYELSRLTDKSISEVLTHYKENKQDGWKQILLSLGIDSHSPRFGDLCKLGFKDHDQHNPLSKNDPD